MRRSTRCSNATGAAPIRTGTGSMSSLCLSARRQWFALLLGSSRDGRFHHAADVVHELAPARCLAHEPQAAQETRLPSRRVPGGRLRVPDSVEAGELAI